MGGEVVIVSEGEENEDENEDEYEEGEENNEIKQFNVIVQKIQRYAVDSQVTFHMNDDVSDLFDVTVITKKRLFKCVLHPKLNVRVHRRLVGVNSMIRVADYTVECDETNYRRNVDFLLIKDFEVLEFQNTGKFNVNKVSYRLRKPKNRRLPLVSSRMYYLPLYNDVDFYGEIWKSLPLPKTKLAEQKQGTVKTIEDLQSMKHGTYLDKSVLGTVITKSRLRHFGKVDDARSRYPFTFTLELEHKGWTCGVSFWNTACLEFFRTIKVGDHILLKNFRLKKRYGKRTNTVYFGQETNVELSINPCNPKGRVELLDDGPSSVPYRFQNFQELMDFSLPKDTIIDVVGIVSFVGRIEREKNIKSDGLNCQDYWMYRWLTLNDGTDNAMLNIKLYACSQPEVMNNIEVGDIFIATRVLFKSIVFCEERGPKLHHCVTCSRETQFYKFNRNWTLPEVDVLPFKQCKRFLDVLRLSKDEEGMRRILVNARTGGYFVYPPLPNSLQGFQQIFNDENNPMEIYTCEKFIQLTESMHVYQSMPSVCLQGTISAIEFVDPSKNWKDYDKRPSKRRKSSNSSTASKEMYEKPCFSKMKILDEQSVMKSDEMTCIGKVDLTDESTQQFLGTQKHHQQFLRFLLTGLNDKLSVLASFLPNIENDLNTNTSFLQILQGYPISNAELNDSDNLFDLADEIKEKQRFLFVMDLHYYGNEEMEVIVNRAYPV